MTGTPLLILFAGAAALVLAVGLYLRGEVPVRGRPALVALRVGVLGIVILLLLDVRLPVDRLPGDDRATGARGAWVLIDSDLSLLLPSEDEGTLWDRAVDRAEAAAEAGAYVALARPGTTGPEGVDPATLRARAPDHPPGDLVEGVLRLAEAGADSVTILSSFRRPPELMERLASETPIPVRLERLGARTLNAGIADLLLPAVVPEGEEVEGQVAIFGEGGAPGDSVVVEIERDGDLIESLVLPLPAPGETATADFLLPAVAEAGPVRYTARALLEGDTFGVDDARSRWVRVGEPEGRIFLLSLRPDWEPRFLLPVLRAVTGLEGEGYLAVAGDRFLPLVEGGEGQGPLPPSAVRERALRAALVVLHGAAGEVEEWVEELVRDHPRVLHFPADPQGAALAGVTVGPAAPGEWPPDPELPSSPLAPFLSGLPLGALPPLTSPLPLEGEPEGTVALRARGSGTGASLPVLLLREENGLRRGVALAPGFWRWGSRDGEARTAYRSLWGGVANWLLVPTAGPEGREVGPVDIVQPRGEPLRWDVPPNRRGAELVLFPTDEAAREAFRGLLDPGSDGVAATPAVDPGIYRYEVRLGGVGDAPAAEAAEGRVEVERWAGSLRLPPLDVSDFGIPASSPALAAEGEGRPLRTHPAPYLLALLLLCAEWVWRRRVGLR